MTASIQALKTVRAGIALAIALVVVAFGVVLTPGAGWAAPDKSGQKVSTAGADLLRIVHQASMVEIWAGRRAQGYSSSPAVKWVGQSVFADHVALDQIVGELAGRYGVTLPTEPTLKQQAGIRKMTRETGEPFDRAFVNALHLGHTEVLPMARSVAQQLNDPPEIRNFAQSAVSVVSKHIAWLEGTGLMTVAHSPEFASQAAMARQVAGAPTYDNTIPLLVGLASLAVFMLVASRLTARRPKRAGAGGTATEGGRDTWLRNAVNGVRR